MTTTASSAQRCSKVVSTGFTSRDKCSYGSSRINGPGFCFRMDHNNSLLASPVDSVRKRFVISANGGSNNCSCSSCDVSEMDCTKSTKSHTRKSDGAEMAGEK